MTYRHRHIAVLRLKFLYSLIRREEFRAAYIFFSIIKLNLKIKRPHFFLNDDKSIFRHRLRLTVTSFNKKSYNKVIKNI